MQRTKPPFRADHVGSLLRPPALKEAREKRAKGEIGAADLKAVEDREIERVIKKQEEVGLKSVTDGEFRRSWWHLDFLWGLDGVERYAMAQGVAFAGVQTPRRRRPRHRQGRLLQPSDDRALQVRAAHTRPPPKITIPSPSSGLRPPRPRRRSAQQVYPDIDDFFRDLGTAYRKAVRAFADAGCRYLQLDEVYIAMLCDANYRASQSGRATIRTSCANATPT